VAKRATAQPKAAKASKAAAPEVRATATHKFTEADVALRAYFISEKRRNQGLSGDEHQDWVEAERQLREESASKPKTRKAALAKSQ
jgi:hypothetical protein